MCPSSPTDQPADPACASPPPGPVDEAALPLRLALRKQAEQQETKHLALFALLWMLALGVTILSVVFFAPAKGFWVALPMAATVLAVWASLYIGHRRWPLPSCPACGMALSFRHLSQSGYCPQCGRLVAREGEVADESDPRESATPVEPTYPLPHRQEALDALVYRAHVDHFILTPLQLVSTLLAAWFGWDADVFRVGGWDLVGWLGLVFLTWLVAILLLDYLIARCAGIPVALRCPWCRMFLSTRQYRKSVEGGCCVLCDGAFTAEGRAAREAAGTSPAPPPKPVAPEVEPPRVPVDPATLPTREELADRAAQFRRGQGGCLWAGVLAVGMLAPPLLLLDGALRWMSSRIPEEALPPVVFIAALVVLAVWAFAIIHLEGKRLERLERRLGLRCPWCDAAIRINPMAVRHKDHFLDHVVQGGRCPACGRDLVSDVDTEKTASRGDRP